MKCQKCAKPAMVHLTEIVSDNDVPPGMGSGSKKAMEIHLCLGHAIEMGLVMPGSDVPPQALAMAASDEPAATGSTAIVPAPVESKGLAVSRERQAKATDAMTCPHCGTNWADFKQAGVMGCSHDYELFAGKLLPLLKRAQEGSVDHVGKVPSRKKSRDTERQVVTLRLRRELQKAVDQEKYEEAAQLRDQLRQMEQH